MSYALQVEERERYALLGALGVDKDPRATLDQALSVRSWALPGEQPRPVVARPRGVPDWWEGDDQASQSFLQAMGIKLP